MTPANVIAFYSQAHWGSRWGVRDAYHPTPHKGLDLGLFHGNVDVPALHAGHVVAVGPSSSVGHYVTVVRPDGLFDTYCHIVPGVSVGANVAQGQRLGRQAQTQSEGGTAWAGQHTHLCLSRTANGWATFTSNNLDPTPGVIAVLTNTAGGGSIPIAPPNEQEDELMALRGYLWTDSKNVRVGALADSVSGLWSPVQANQDYFNALNASGIPFTPITESHAGALARDHAAVRNAAAPVAAVPAK